MKLYHRKRMQRVCVLGLQPATEAWSLSRCSVAGVPALAAHQFY